MIYRNHPLKSHNSFRIDCCAAHFVTVNTIEEAEQAIDMKYRLAIPCMILGKGNNTLFTADYNGMIIQPTIPGIYEEERSGDDIIVSVGAGIDWDTLVQWAVDHNYCGLENLSGIPGAVGAVPIQNIGAYGAEAAGAIFQVDTIDMKTTRTRTFSNKDCRFGYRSSIFKHEYKNSYLIYRVYFKLSLRENFKLDYGTLSAEVDRLGVASPASVRQAVINIRAGKLPDPAMLGNAGSFFKNPVIDTRTANMLKQQYPAMPLYTAGETTVKVSAAWLIEQCGWKGKRKGDAGVYDRQALVIVNHGNATGRQIVELAGEIKQSVVDTFGITLEPEVEIVGSI